MGLWQRIFSAFGNRANATLDRFEDPRDTMEGAYRTHLAALQEAKRGVVEVLTNEKRLELEANALQASAVRALASATESAHAGDDASARRYLRREAFVAEQRERFLGEIAEIRAQRISLEALVERLSDRTDRIRTEKSVLRARYATSKAGIRAGESVIGISDEMETVARDLERARDASRDAEARAAALAALAARGFDRDDEGTDARIESRLIALKGGMR